MTGGEKSAQVTTFEKRLDRLPRNLISLHYDSLWGISSAGRHLPLLQRFDPYSPPAEEQMSILGMYIKLGNTPV